MLHIVFKENGVAVNNAEQAEKIANALLNADYKGTILSYVEFNSVEDMLIFFKLLKLLQMFGDPTKLEEQMATMKREKENLESLLNSMLDKRIIVEINGNTSQVSLRTLTEGVDIYGYFIKIDVSSEEKIKITFNKK